MQNKEIQPSDLNIHPVLRKMWETSTQSLKEAQDSLHAKGIPICYMLDGKIVLESPDGSIKEIEENDGI